jgi:hypothetical protein
MIECTRGILCNINVNKQTRENFLIYTYFIIHNNNVLLLHVKILLQC